VNQTAIETSLQGRFRLSVRRDLHIDLPFAASSYRLMTMAFNESLDNAARLAMRNMTRLLEEHYGLGFHDAYRLCSVAADMRVTQFVNGNRAGSTWCCRWRRSPACGAGPRSSTRLRPSRARPTRLEPRRSMTVMPAAHPVR
jgi:hypothetical protein